MAKSIHERVRATLAKKATEDKRAADQAHDKIMRANERLDLEYEKGVAAYERDGVCPPNASKEMRRGFQAASRSELEG